MATKKTKKKAAAPSGAARGYDWREWREIPDPTPVEIPVNMGMPETLESKMRRFIEDGLQRRYNEETSREAESFAEANDFTPDVDEDTLDLTSYERAALADEEPLDPVDIRQAQTEHDAAPNGQPPSPDALPETEAPQENVETPPQGDSSNEGTQS